MALYTPGETLGARVSVGVRVFATVLALSTLSRLVISARLETTGWSLDPVGVLTALAAGIVADGGVALAAVGLVMALITLFSRPRLRVLGHVVFAGLMLALVFATVCEWFFWEEFASRLNAIAVFYLMFPREVIGNLRESFNLPLYLPPVVATGVWLWWAARHKVAAALTGTSARFGTIRAFTACVLLGGGGLMVVSAAPSNFSANRELNELALNGLANVVSAAVTNDSDYDGVYPGIEEQRALSVLRRTLTQDNVTFLDPPEVRSVRRWIDNGPQPKKLNVVLVIEESLGSRFVDVLDNTDRQTITPTIDRLADQSLFFTNVYASGQRSVRGLEAILTAFTPIPGISTARRPGSLGMHSLPAVLARFGYESSMLYGGRAAFDNMGNFWRGIGFDHVWDQSDIVHPSFTTAWGVSDEDLFAEALKRMDAAAGKGRPVFLSMFTVSNHRPYKFPQTHVRWNPSLGNRENTAHYADWAYGDFLEQARTRAWFDDTVFVFVADHGHKVNGAAAVPLHRYRIPMLFYSPKHIAPRKVTTLAAQIDLIPTLLGQLGLSYESSFFGLDLARVPEDGGRIAVAHNFSVAFAVPGHAVVLAPDGPETGYRFLPGVPELEPEPVDPRTDEKARAITQTAHRMFYAGEYHEDRPNLSPSATSTASVVVDAHGHPGRGAPERW